MNFTNKNFIFHIGLHRTGSTFMQKHLNLIKNDDFKLFILDDFCDYLIDYLEDPNQIKKEYLYNIISKIKEKNIVISSEGIFGHHYNGFVDVKQRFKRLEDLFENIKYIICFREPSSITYSTYLGLLINVDFKIKFENYINEEINNLHTQKIHKIKRTTSLVKTNYKIFDYNIIFEDYLKIQNRVLFIEFEKFFKNQDVTKLNKFVGVKIDFNFSEKVNAVPKNIIYLQFYNKFLLFKLIKIFLINFLKIFNKINSPKDILFTVDSLIGFFNKFVPKKYYDRYNQEVQKLLVKIKTYHLKKYLEFKKKLNPKFHIVFNTYN